MARHILAGVSLALIVLVSGIQHSLADENSFSNSQLEETTPSKSDFAFHFYKEAATLMRSMSNETARDYNDDLCETHLDEIWQGIKDYREWALECKQILCKVDCFFFFLF